MCLDTSAWLVASEEQLSGRPVRIWRAIEPVETILRPDDPAIPWVPITSESVSALGWCGPEFGDGRLVGPTVVEAWAVSGAGLRTLVLLRLRPTGPASSLGGLYRPAFAPTAISPTAAWPAGRYLFRIRSGDGRVFTFGVQVETVPPQRSPGVTWRPGGWRHGLSAAWAGRLHCRCVGATRLPPSVGFLRNSRRPEFWRRTPCPSEDASRF